MSSPPVPGWYTPFSIPEGWIGSFHPLVRVVGLDFSETVERRVWELLNLPTSQGTTGGGGGGGGVGVPQQDLHLIPGGDPLPPRKPRREGLEASTYIPGGLLPSQWIKKHRETIPAVVVVFVKDVEFKDPSTSILTRLREECTPYGTQVLVMLVRLGDHEEMSAEKASNLCASADLPPKSLYILFTSHPDRVHASVHRLEKGIRESSTSYYASRIRRLKSNKERTLQPALQVRYNIKLAFFFEIRKDHASALSHYEMALEGLIRLIATAGALQEVKAVASIVTYRICRLHFIKREVGEAKTKFHRHLSIFKNSTVPRAELRFEHLSFLEQQYHIFGDLAKAYFTPESMNTADPVNYFILSAKYAQERAELKKGRGDTSQPPPHELMIDPSWQPLYVGQRPWTGGGEEEVRRIPLLQWIEGMVPHSELVINHLGLASEFCKTVGRLRTRCQLMSQMGEEFYRSGEYSRCTLLMGHVLREFGIEKWTSLLLHVARVGLYAALRSSDAPAYLNFLVILLRRDIRGLMPPEESNTLSNNLERVVRSREVPQHPDIPINNPGAFTSPEQDIKSYVGVHSESLLDTWISFSEESAPVQRPSRILFKFKNRHDRPLNIKGISIQTNLTDYDVSKEVGEKLGVGEKLETFLELTPLTRDANKVIQLQMGIVDIGEGNVSVLLHYSMILRTVTPILWNEERTALNVLKIDGAKPMLQCTVLREEPALVGEVHRITFRWTNTDTSPVSRVALTFFMSTTNPQLVRLSPDPEALSKPSGGGLSHSVEVERLDPLATHETTIYLRVSGEMELRLISKAKYFDTPPGISSASSSLIPLGTDFFIPISVVTPFSISSKMTDTQGGEMSLCRMQLFILLHQLTNITSTPINIVKVEFKVAKTHFVQYAASAGLPVGERLVLKPKETLGAMQMLQLMEESENAGGNGNLISLLVHWSRASAFIPEEVVVTSELMVPLPKIGGDSTPGIYISGQFSVAYLKEPMSATYVVYNRSSSTQDLVLSLDSTESFMNAGPKKTCVKLNPTCHTELSFVLFPLKTGLVTAPKLLVEQSTTDQAVPNPPSLVVQRDHVKTLFIRRKEESEELHLVTGEE